MPKWFSTILQTRTSDTRERRRGQRIPVRQTIRLSLGNGGHQLSAVSANISSGGAFIYCDKFLAIDSEVALILDFPPDITRAALSRVWCRVLRIDGQLTEGRFGIALAFTSVQPLPEA